MQPAARILAATAETAAVLAGLGTTAAGLDAAEAARRLDVHGPNLVTEHLRPSAAGILLKAVLNPLVVVLGVLAGFAVAGGDVAAAALMAVMLVIGVGLRFVQESRADAAAEALRRMIRIHATVVRDGVAAEVPLEALVPGDVVLLAAGDMVPADVRIIACKDLFVSQSVLTGESFPVEKSAAACPAAGHEPLAMPTLCWLGTSVESGTGRAVVLATGRDTLLGGTAAALEPPEAPTAFDVGLARFTWLMVAFVAVMVPLVFGINWLGKGDPVAAALFALAVGVGLTPEMLPMIVAVCLARGALDMAGQRVIVKHTDAIQNLGAMDVLCTDKTGTLTLDRIILERHCDLRLREDSWVLELAWLNSHFQTGLKSVMNGLFAEKRGRSKDARRTLPVPGFAPLLVELALVPAPAGGAGTLRTLPIMDARGTPASGRPVGGDNQRPLLHPTTGAELPWDPLGLDPEGLVRLPGGGFWVAEEYVPSLLEIAADGTIRGRFAPAGSGGQDVLPAAYARRRDNRGFEALACTPDGALVYCLLQSPIDDDAEKRSRSRNVRLLVFDAARRRPVAEHFYRLGRPEDERGSGRDQDADGKVSAAAWAGPGRLLVLEQSEKDSRIYAVDLSGATDTLARPGQQTLDAVEPLEEAGVEPVRKTRVVDLELFARRFQADIDPAAGARMKPADLKFEGMAVLGGGRIAIVNDNDFDIGEDGATPRSPPGRRTCVWILRPAAMPRP